MPPPVFRRPLAAWLLLAALHGSAGGARAQAVQTRPAGPPILAGCEADYPPYCVVNEEGLADGFSTELLRAAVNAVGREVDYRTGAWSDLKKDLVEGRIQALPLAGRTPEREAVLDFTFPYLTMHGTIFVRRGDDRIRGAADLAGRRVAVMKGANAEEFLNRAGLGSEAVPRPSFEVALRELSAGEHDAVVIQTLVAQRLMAESGIRNLTTVGRPVEGFTQQFCFAVKEGDHALLSALNEGLAAIRATGEYRAIRARWLGPYEAQPDLATIVRYVLLAVLPLLSLLAGSVLWSRSLSGW